MTLPKNPTEIPFNLSPRLWILQKEQIDNISPAKSFPKILLRLIKSFGQAMAFDYSRRVYLGDTDAAGVVYFARGMEICHEAYEESLAVAGISLRQILREGKIALPIIHAEIDFLRPLFCGDRLQVNLVANRVNQSEFSITYRICTTTNCQILVKAQTSHVCIDPQQRARVNLPMIMLDWLEKNKP